MKAAQHFDDSRVEIYKYLQTVNTDSAKVVFCERFDEKSNICRQVFMTVLPVVL